MSMPSYPCSRIKRVSSMEASTLPTSVLPTPASPSRRRGFRRLSPRKTAAARPRSATYCWASKPACTSSMEANTAHSRGRRADSRAASPGSLALPDPLCGGLTASVQGLHRLVDRVHHGQEIEIPVGDDEVGPKGIQHGSPDRAHENDRLVRHQLHLSEVPGERHLPQCAGATGEGDQGVALDQCLNALEQAFRRPLLR